MLDDRTLGEYATSPDTGISATLVNTGQIRGTLGTGHAFGTAVGWSAEIVGQTGACRRTAHIDAFRVGSTGRRLTGVTGFFGNFNRYSYISQVKPNAIDS